MTAIQRLDSSMVAQELGKALRRGWKRFQQSEEKRQYITYFRWLRKYKFYKSPFQELFPNPAYDAAVKDMGKEFLERAHELGVFFHECFPGEFTQSQKYSWKGHRARSFRLWAHWGEGQGCELFISFNHCHRKLDFPKPPDVLVIED